MVQTQPLTADALAAAVAASPAARTLRVRLPDDPDTYDAAMALAPAHGLTVRGTLNFAPGEWELE